MTLPGTFRVEGGEVRLVRDTDYGPEVLRLVRGARERCWCSLFIVDLHPGRDPELAVPGVLRELAVATWRGVDARLLLGGSRSNLAIAHAVTTTLMVARHLGIPSRGLARDQRGSHVKLVVADDWVLTGSHNWSPGSFGGETQDSVAVRSADLASGLAALFRGQWRRAGA